VAIHEVICGENYSVFLMNTFLGERARLLQIFEEQRSMSAELAVMMALNLKKSVFKLTFNKNVRNI
jgi:hypothetical protein